MPPKKPLTILAMSWLTKSRFSSLSIVAAWSTIEAVSRLSSEPTDCRPRFGQSPRDGRSQQVPRSCWWTGVPISKPVAAEALCKFMSGPSRLDAVAARRHRAGIDEGQ